MFSICIILNLPNSVTYLKYLKQIKNSYSTQVRQQYLRCTYTKYQFQNTECFSKCTKFSKSTQFYAEFTISMTGNDTGNLLKCVRLYRKFININEIKHTLRKKNIAATSLKMLCTHFYPLKGNGERNMKVLGQNLAGA